MYLYSSMVTILCSRNTVREFAHIFLLWRGPFLWSTATAGKHTQGAGRSAWVTSGSLLSLERLADLPTSLERSADLSPSLERPADLCLQSKITDIILSFRIPCGNMNILFANVFSVYCWLSELTYFRLFR